MTTKHFLLLLLDSLYGMGKTLLFFVSTSLFLLLCFCIQYYTTLKGNNTVPPQRIVWKEFLLSMWLNPYSHLYIFLRKKLRKRQLQSFFALSPHSSFLFTISGKILSAYSKRALATAISILYWLTLTAFSLTFSYPVISTSMSNALVS